MPVLFILLWSSGYIFVESGLQQNGPLGFLLMRLFFAWAIVVIILFIQRPLFSVTKLDVARMLLTGLLTQGFYQVFLFAAIYQGLSPGILTIILGMQPVLTVLFLRESLRTVQLVGITLGMLGLALTVFNSIFMGSHSLVSIYYAFASLFGITIGTILQKKYCGNQPLTTNLFFQYLASVIFVFTLYVLLDNKPIQWTGNFIVSLSWMVLVVSISATYLYYALLKRNKAATVTSYLYCMPPITAILDYIIYHHTLSETAIIGMMLVMISLVLIHKRNKPGLSLQAESRS